MKGSDRIVDNGLKALSALPFLAGGVALVGFGDTTSRPLVVVLGFVLFAPGMIWVGMCAYRAILAPTSEGDE